MDAGRVDGWVWTPQVVDTAWRVTRPARTRLHGGSCPHRRAPLSEDGLWGAECVRVGCSDLLHDMLLGLARHTPPDSAVPHPAWLVATVRTQLAELNRTTRVRQGLPARPARQEGPAEHVMSALRAQPCDSEQIEWLIVLFRMIRSYPFIPGRTGQEWPVEAWCMEKSLRSGGRAVSPREVAADIRQVLDLAAETAGASWVHRSILQPLLSVAVGDSGLVLASSSMSVEERALLSLAADTFASRRRAGDQPPAAWRAAVSRLGGRAGSRPPGWAVELLESLVAA